MVLEDMSLVLLFLLIILIFIGYLAVKDKEIFPILLYFFIAVDIIITILMIYFVTYIKYNNIIDTGYVLVLMNFVILIGFLFEKKTGDSTK